MAFMIKKAAAVLQLLRSQGPEKDVSKRWLLRTPGRLDRKFRSSAAYSYRERGEFWEVTVKDQKFLWPRSAPKAMILQLLSEILTPGHPHQYQYGPTVVGPDDVVLDIGACEGSFSALVTARCKRVVAVEPSTSMCRLIAELFKMRDEPSPQVLKCLLGAEAGKAYFLEDAHNPGASRITAEPVPGAYEVPVRTIDEVVESMDDKPTFIKCDAEGAEIEIFSGGKRFLSEFHPKLAITTYHNDGDFAAMYDLLKSLGYNVMGKGFLFSPGRGVLRVHMIHAW
jgi:FkbM family methyltransferase